MTSLIEDIKLKKDNKNIIEKCISELFIKGSINFSTLEKLSYIKIFDKELFNVYENTILLKMGLFFKSTTISNFDDIVFNLFKESIYEKTNYNFTPIQADIVEKINENKSFAFSSPTSTGKSHIFMYLLKNASKDVVIIVPSRALINEYYKKIKEIFYDDFSINVLTFVDKINIERTKRNIFIITPERTRDLFALKKEFNFEYILFDEAQLSDDNKSVRGLYYDSVIRRCNRIFTEAKFVYAYPFIKNPEAQFIRNKIDYKDSSYNSYNYKNVGQIFYSFDKGTFFHFGIDFREFGNKVKCEYDPLEKVIKENGTALIYCSKSKIYDGRIFDEFSKYINLCKEITNPDAIKIIEDFSSIIGASQNGTSLYKSRMVLFLRRGIVIHHGSLPLSARTVLEMFTQKGYCNLCFATSTLDQGINMPFDLVWIDKFLPSQSLNVKNLIGRAGRSTTENIFDYGQVVISDHSKGRLRKIVQNDNVLSIESELDKIVEENDDYKEYKEAIKNDQFNEELNLTNSEVDRIQKTRSVEAIKYILSYLFNDEGKLTYCYDENNKVIYKNILKKFQVIYETYLNRELTSAEYYILNNAINIMFLKIKGRKFNQIVWFRYAYASNMTERRRIINNKKLDISEKEKMILSLEAKDITEYQAIPNKKINPIILTYDNKNKRKIKAIDVDYDRIMVDTYDYMDKLLGFRFGDVYYAAFYQYAQNNNDKRALAMANYIRYGTNDEKEIWLLRYGLDFEDFDWLYDEIERIDERGIIIKDNNKITKEQLDKIERYII